MLRQAAHGRRALCRRGSLAAPRLYSQQPSHPQTPSVPNADTQLGDYPDVPAISRQYRSPLGWDDVQNRRNHGDPIPEEGELYGMWAPDIPVAEPHMALRHFSLVFGGFGAFLYFLYKFAPEPPVVPRAIVSHEAGNGRVPTEDITVTDGRGMGVNNGQLFTYGDSKPHH